jgi:hypothetical protein
VYFRDDSESYNHYTNGSWGGISSKAVSDVNTYTYGTTTPDKDASAKVGTCSQETCGHAPNTTGGALTYSAGTNNSVDSAACSPCAQRVCQSDSYCCTYSWDSICVSEAKSWCGCQ